MKLLFQCLFIFSLLSACSKTTEEKHHAYLDLKIAGSALEYNWQEIEGEWELNGLAKIYAVSDNGDQFSLNLANVTDTGRVAGLSVREISFTDALYFRPDKVLSGYVRLTTKDPHRLMGDFDVEFESVNHVKEKRRIIGTFGIIH